MARRRHARRPSAARRLGIRCAAARCRGGAGARHGPASSWSCGRPPSLSSKPPSESLGLAALRGALPDPGACPTSSSRSPSTAASRRSSSRARIVLGAACFFASSLVPTIEMLRGGRSELDVAYVVAVMVVPSADRLWRAARRLLGRRDHDRDGAAADRSARAPLRPHGAPDSHATGRNADGLAGWRRWPGSTWARTPRAARRDRSSGGLGYAAGPMLMKRHCWPPTAAATAASSQSPGYAHPPSCSRSRAPRPRRTSASVSPRSSARAAFDLWCSPRTSAPAAHSCSPTSAPGRGGPGRRPGQARPRAPSWALLTGGSRLAEAGAVGIDAMYGCTPRSGRRDRAVTERRDGDSRLCGLMRRLRDGPPGPVPAGGYLP